MVTGDDFGFSRGVNRAIVEAHAGKIGAMNRIAADGTVLGATFWFMLPANETPAP